MRAAAQPQYEWSSRQSRFSYGVAALIIAVWICNTALIVCSVFMFINWGAVDWLVGDTAYVSLSHLYHPPPQMTLSYLIPPPPHFPSCSWAIVVAVICALFMLYTLTMGCCILGFRQHTQRSYLSLRTKPKCRAFSVGVVPLITIIFFLILCAMTLSDSAMSTEYIRAHSDNIYKVAFAKPTAIPNPAGVLLDQFQQYMTGLPQFAHLKDDDAFLDRMSRLFDAMDRNDKEYLTRDDMFHGMLDSLAPLRNDFGYSALGVFLVALFFFIAYLASYAYLRSTKLEKQIEALKEQKALFAAQQAAAEAAAASSATLLDVGVDEQARMFDYMDDELDAVLIDEDDEDDLYGSGGGDVELMSGMYDSAA